MSLRTFSKGYDFKRKEYVDIPNCTYFGYINFSQHHISYDLGNISYDSPQPIYSNNHIIQGTFLFDEKGKLYFIKIPKNIIHKLFEQVEQEQSLSIFEKKHDTKWEFNAYDKVYLTKKFMRKSYRYKRFDKISHIYEIKNGSIYKDNKPVIIYNYYN